MRLNLNLFTRGIILISFPILCQLIFILVIATVMRQAQDTLEKQWRSENLLRLTFSICREVTDLLLWLQLPAGWREMIGVDVSSSWLVRAKKETEMLRQLGDEDPDKGPALAQMIDSKAYMFDVLERMLAANDPTAPWTGALPNFKPGLRTHGKFFYDSVEEIVAIEKKKDQVSDVYAAVLSIVQTAILAIAFLCIGLALLVGYLYAISIRRPLRHLSQNGQLLSEQKPLLPLLSTNDEFAQIDNLLHTAAREIENTLAKEKEVIENAQDMVCTTDANGVFLTVNPFVERMLGCRPADAVSRPISQFTVPAQNLLCDELLRSAIASESVKQFELQLIHAQGDIVETQWSCLWSQSEKKLFCVVRDVTEEKRIEQLKQDFTNMISHDLRSPLMAMGNALTLIKTGVTGKIPQTALQRVETSSKNVDKLIVLVNDLLDFQKLKAGKMELALQSVSLQSILKDAAELVEEAARSKNVEIELPEGETIVQGDRNKLMQTAVNLISNAIKFSGENGQVVVQVYCDADSVFFSVTDSGPGIAWQFQERIFEPFEQAPSEKRKEGTGLGLAICRLVVEAHGGSISVANRGDENPAVSGCVFTVQLPFQSS